MAEYTIRQISQLYKVPASTLRYYEDIGLLTDVKHMENGQRVYDETHIARMDGIRCFKNTGMSIASMVEFFKYEANLPEDIDKILSLVEGHEKNIEEQMKKMKKDLEHIKQKVTYYTKVKDAIEKGVKIPSWDEVFNG